MWMVAISAQSKMKAMKKAAMTMKMKVVILSARMRLLALRMMIANLMKVKVMATMKLKKLRQYKDLSHHWTRLQNKEINTTLHTYHIGHGVGCACMPEGKKIHTIMRSKVR